MNAGRVIAVVGASGVGKDSVMNGICAAAPKLRPIRRVITRDANLGGEDYDAVTFTEFNAQIAANAFALHWQAHGLNYGIPITINAHLANGTDCLVNLSRSALDQAAQVFPKLLILNITAEPDCLAKRLHNRGRESPTEIAKRLAQAQKPLPKGLNVTNLSNDGPLEATIYQALQCIQPES